MSYNPVNGGIQHGHITSAPVQKQKPKPTSVVKAPKPVPVPEVRVEAPAMAWSDKLDLQKRPVIEAPVTDAVANAVQENTAPVNPVPDEIRSLRWSWGAMLLPFWWLLFHKFIGSAILFYIAAICLSAFVTPLQQQYLGAHFVWVTYVISTGVPSVFTAIAAHKIAWRRGKYADVAQYMQTEKKWLIAGIAVNAGVAAILFAVSFLHH